jgi:hypothetical protein
MCGPLQEKTTMKRWILILMALVLFLPPRPAPSAHEKHAGTSPGAAFRGEVLDLACYIPHGGKGPEHQKCALKCAEQGQPLGLLTPEGKVYLLFADHTDATAFEKTKALAGKTVEITGEASGRDGINGLTVLAVKAL